MQGVSIFLYCVFNSLLAAGVKLFGLKCCPKIRRFLQWASFKPIARIYSDREGRLYTVAATIIMTWYNDKSQNYDK